MKASKKSIHAKLHEFTYMSDLPKNLCPYFWKLVWATLIFIPNFIIQFPSLLINFFQTEKNDCSENRALGLITYGVSAALLLLSLLEYNCFKALFGAYSYNQAAANIGLTLNCVGLFFLLRWLWIDYIRYWKIFSRNRPYKEPQPSIIVEFVKAKYNKYCPKIDWE